MPVDYDEDSHQLTFNICGFLIIMERRKMRSGNTPVRKHIRFRFAAGQISEKKK